MRTKAFIIPVLVVVVLLAVAVFIPVSTTPANADMGPKPSIQITFKNLPEERCYGTMLSQKPDLGPHYVQEPMEITADMNEEEAAYAKAHDAFVAYNDPDGFYFVGIMSKITEGRLECRYYPPEVFKVVLYFPDSGEFVSGDIQKTYAFDSYYTAEWTRGDLTVSEDGKESIEMTKSYDYAGEIVSLAVRILLTLLIEIGIALLFRYRQKKKITTLLVTNFFTNVLLNIALYVIYYFSGELTFAILFILAEFVVFVIEAIVYSVVFRKDTPRSPVIKSIFYAFIANLFSCVAGLILGFWFPRFF